ncbi:signal peptidase I [Tistrella bauzanensis]|uniref:Signal peptidase I n=1 Tax=Tistrella arctica TaxID=3133430 RepID=A0ABU9YF52_9PROT
MTRDTSRTDGDHPPKTAERSGGFGEMVKTVVIAVFFALVIRSFAFEPFNIPSGSMKPTLLVGDYLFVSKYSYGYSRYSFPGSLPLFEGRILASPVERGDVAVFRLPTDPSIDYIKRIVGLPGDRLQVIDGVLQLNGTPVERKRIEDFVERGPGGAEIRIPRYQETLPGGPTYDTLDQTPYGALDNTPVYTVPAGHYFAMGDNRDNSQDSRVLSAVGFVPEQNLIGRAEVLFFSIDDSASWWQIWKWPASIRWSRLLDGVS